MKKNLKPLILATREQMEFEAAEFVRLKIEYLAISAAMEERKAQIERESAKVLADLVQCMELRFAAVQNFCQLHRLELLPDREKKSFTTVNAVIGFRDTPPAVDKASSRETWEAVAVRLSSLVFDLPENAKLYCDNYVREGKPAVNKDALLADRALFTPDQLRAMGLRFTQEEHFYISPLAEIVEETTSRT